MATQQIERDGDLPREFLLRHGILSGRRQNGRWLLTIPIPRVGAGLTYEGARGEKFEVALSRLRARKDRFVG